MVESKAVEILREELEQSENCSERVNHLSIRVKWGQNDLIGIGALRTFLEKYPEVFSFDGHVVKLVNPRGQGKPPAAPSKAGGPPGLAPPPPVPQKRGWGGNNDGEPESPDSKARKGYGGKGGMDMQEDSALDDYLNVPAKGAGAPTSKAKWGGAPPSGKGPDGKGPDQGFGKGAGKVIKGGYDGKGGGFEGKGGGFDGDKGGFKGDGKDGAKGDKGDKGGKGGKGTGKEYGKDDGLAHQDLSPQERKLALQEDRLAPHQAQLGIETFKTNGVEIELSLLSKKVMPSEEARRNAQRCLALVRSAVQSGWGQPGGPGVPSVVMCGSYAQGTEVHGSAMDLAFRLPSNSSFEDRANAVSELRSRLSQQQSLLEVNNTMEHYPHTTSPLAIDLKDCNPGLVAHILLEEQRVNRPPTVDEAIKQMCDTFQASYDLVRLVKVWSVNHGLTNQQDGFINGVAWTLLTIFFLQKQKLIPPYSVVAQGGHIQPASTTMPLSSLLQGFYEFLANRSTAPKGISVWQGNDFEGPVAFFIEDPSHMHEAGQSRSLSETLGEPQWNRVLDEAKKAFNRIKVRPGRWFHWAEVFDPTDRKPAKIHGLAQHLAGIDMGGDSGKGKGADTGLFSIKGAGKDFDGKGIGKDFDGKGAGKDFDSKGAGKDFDGKGAGKDFDGKGAGKDFDGKGAGKDFDSKGAGKDFDGKGPAWSDKGSDGKGYSDGKGPAWGGKDSDGKGAPWSGKDSDGKGPGWSGKDAGAKGGKDSDGKGAPWSSKDSDSKGWSGKDAGGKGGKDWDGGGKGGKDWGGKDSDGKGKDSDKGYGKWKGSGKGMKPY